MVVILKCQYLFSTTTTHFGPWDFTSELECYIFCKIIPPLILSLCLGFGACHDQRSGLLYSWPLIFSCLSCPTQFVREKYWTHLSNQGVKIHVREVQPQIFSFKTKNYNNYQEAKVNSVNKPGTCCFMFKMGGDLISLIPDPLAIVNWQW